MAQHPQAGRRPDLSKLTDIPALISAYYTIVPDPALPRCAVKFGTSGHRGSSENGSFNEAHVLAMAQAVCDFRAKEGIAGPLFLGRDSHALSEPALRSTLEVLVANGVSVCIQENNGLTPTPTISRSIIRHNRQNSGPPSRRADGIVLTPSHNPPEDGGFKYNPPHGGPAETGITTAIERRANELLKEDLKGVRRIPWERALRSDLLHPMDLLGLYVEDLGLALDLESIARSGLKIGADPLGGASVAYWPRIAERYKLNITLLNPLVDPTFRFVPQDHDGKIRMDCSSPWAMAGLLEQQGNFDIAFGNDTDADRHGIVTRSGLMNPNHYLCAAVWHLLRTRAWNPAAAVGKTLVTTALLDRVAAAADRKILEVPVGFKWFVDGLHSGGLAFGGEESAGASFLCLDGSPWTTDKDGILLGLLAAEITAVQNRDPSSIYGKLTGQLGNPAYARLDAPASEAQRKVFPTITQESLGRKELAGEPITAVLTRAPGNNEPIGGVKVATANAWFAARPSGTEDLYKIYAESFLGSKHLEQVQTEAKELVQDAFAAAGV